MKGKTGELTQEQLILLDTLVYLHDENQKKVKKFINLCYTGVELFSERVLLKNGQYSNGAIDVLSEFDENGDGILNSEDSIFDKIECISYKN